MNETALGCECKSTKEQSVGGQLLEVMDEVKAGQQAWPPYFDEMRAILKDIARFIRDTQRTIKRVEL